MFTKIKIMWYNRVVQKIQKEKIFMASKNLKIVDKKENEKEGVPYTLYVGVIDIENNSFNWFEVESFDDLEKAYKRFKDFVIEQLKYTDEELQSVWGIGRLDIELKQGKKLVNWVGIYSREVVDDETGEPLVEKEGEPKILKSFKKVESEKEDFKDSADDITNGIKQEIAKHITSEDVASEINLNGLFSHAHTREGKHLLGNLIDYGTFAFSKKVRDVGYKILDALEEKYPNLKIDADLVNGEYVIHLTVEELPTKEEIDELGMIADDVDKVLFEYDGNKVINTRTNEVYIYWNIDPIRNLPQKVFGPFTTKESLNAKLRELGLPLV